MGRERVWWGWWGVKEEREGWGGSVGVSGFEREERCGGDGVEVEGGEAVED